MRTNPNYKIGGAYNGFRAKKSPQLRISVAFNNHFDWIKQYIF